MVDCRVQYTRAMYRGCMGEHSVSQLGRRETNTGERQETRRSMANNATRIRWTAAGGPVFGKVERSVQSDTHGHAAPTGRTAGTVELEAVKEGGKLV